MADDAGALLVRSGLVTASALEGARARAVEVGGTVSEQLVADGTVTDELLTDFYKSRLLVPQVNANTLARLAATIVAVIPTDLAIELRAIPVSLDAENNLTVAMSDPSDRHAVDEIAYVTGAYVVRAVATQMQIAWCLAHYYGYITTLGQRLLTPAAAATPVSAPRGRPRGITGEVEAMRHRGLVPGEASTATSSGGIKQPRPHSISGEIRPPRAPSVRPTMPEDSGPVITMEADDTSGDGGPPIAESAALARTRETSEGEDTDRAARPAPKRKRPAEPDPPELAARAGEVDLKSGADRAIGSGPSIVIDGALERDGVPEHVAPGRAGSIARRALQGELSGEINVGGLREVSGEIRIARRDPDLSRTDIAVSRGDDDGAVMIHESLRPTRIEDEPSAPILLDRKRPSDPPKTSTPRPPPPGDEDDEVVELDSKKTMPLPIITQAKREHRRTEVGLGIIGMAGPRGHRDTVEASPAQLEDDPTGEHKIAAAIDRARQTPPPATPPGSTC